MSFVINSLRAPELKKRSFEIGSELKKRSFLDDENGKNDLYLKEKTLNSNNLKSVGGDVMILDGEEKASDPRDAEILKRLMWSASQWARFNFHGFDGGPKGLTIPMLANLARDCQMSQEDLQESLNAFADYLVNGQSEHIHSPIGYWIKYTRLRKCRFVPPESYLADKHGSSQFTPKEQRQAQAKEAEAVYDMIARAPDAALRVEGQRPETAASYDPFEEERKPLSEEEQKKFDEYLKAAFACLGDDQ